MELQHYFEKEICVISLLGTLDWGEIDGIRDYILARLIERETQRILLNCKDVDGMESKGVGLISAIYKPLSDNKKSLGLFNLHAPGLEALRIFHVDQMVGIYKTEKDAIAQTEKGASAQTKKGASPQMVDQESSQEEQDIAAEKEDEGYHPLLQLTVTYFKNLEEQTKKDEEVPQEENRGVIVEAEDGFSFDQISIREALVMCDQLQNFLTQLSTPEFKMLQSIQMFFKSPERLLYKMKLFYMGDLKVKERIIRIYVTKAFGSYKIIRNIFATTALFEAMDPEATAELKDKLLKYAEETFIKTKKIIPFSAQVKVRWNRKNLIPGVQKILTEQLLFHKDYDYQKATQQYRELIFDLYANPHMQLYLDWKDKYLKHWLYTELHQQDVQHLTDEQAKLPRYTSIKIQIYQQLSSIFLTLEGEDQVFDKKLLLKKTEMSTLIRGEAFLPTSEDILQNYFNRARESEKNLLDALSINQIATVAEWVHKEIMQLKRNQQLEGDLPPGLNTRQSDIASEQKAEEAYTAKTIEVQEEQAKKEKEGQAPSKKFLNALNLLKSKFKLGQKKEVYKPAEPPPPQIPPRVSEPQKPLEPAEVDWVGFGREFKSTVYEPRIPNLQKMVFDHGELKLYLFENFETCGEAILQFYTDLGYLKKTAYKVGVNVSGRSLIKTFEDEAIYLKTTPETFLVLGRSPFSKTSDPVLYFQLYRAKVAKPYQGTTKNIDFSRKMDGVKYDLENFEKMDRIRPILFLNLLYVVDSLPDTIRNQHQEFLKGMHRFLEEMKSATNTEQQTE